MTKGERELLMAVARLVMSMALWGMQNGADTNLTARLRYALKAVESPEEPKQGS